MFETKDKTGKAARSAPKAPGALEGDVMMADVETKDHWRISDTWGIRVHVEPRFKDYNPLHEGGVPEEYLAGSACKVRKVFADGSVKDCEVVLGNGSLVESQAWTGFTFFRRAQDPFRAMALLEADAGDDFAEFSAFAAQRVGPDAAAATHEGKVAKTLNINDVDEETRKVMLEARQKDWDKHKTFNAAVVVSGAEKARLLSEGHQVIPSKWLDTIKTPTR